MDVRRRDSGSSPGHVAAVRLLQGRRADGGREIPGTFPERSDLVLVTKNISVVSYAPAPTGTTTMTDPRTFNHIGKVSGLKWSFNFPGGAYQCSGLLEIPPEQRESCLTYGRILRVFRGGPKYIWDGNIDSAVQTPKGWEFTAHGIGAQGDDFTADFPIPIMDNITGVVRNPWTLQGPLTAAYGRGLRWHQFS